MRNVVLGSKWPARDPRPRDSARPALARMERLQVCCILRRGPASGRDRNNSGGLNMKRIAIALALVGAGTIGLANTSHAMTLPAPSALKEAVPSNASPV